MEHTATTEGRPLCVDLDGTLVRTDLLDEQLVVMIRHNPLALPRLIPALMRGKAAFKEELARQAAESLDVAHLPYDEDVLNLVRQRRAEGGRIELVSGSHQSVVAKVAQHLGVFDDGFGSGDGRNLTGATKAAMLQARHPQGFDYIGNGKADIPVWHAAADAMVAQAPAAGTNFSKKIESLSTVSTRPDERRSMILRALRCHQWVKNGLVFLPLLLTLSPQTSLSDIGYCVLGFLAFCLLSSGSYLLNDIFDVQADRRHLSKRRRAIASGFLSIRAGGLIGVGLMGLGFALGAAISMPFVATLAAYTCLTLLYSLVFKRLISFDVLILTILFLLRAFAGSVIIDHPLTVWLAAFLMFFFLALAIGKRVIELKRIGADGAPAGFLGRAYEPGDITVMIAAGVTLSMASVLLFMIYGILGQQSLYHDDWAIILTGGLLGYWSLRFWVLVGRDTVDFDPVAFVLRDWATFFTLAAIMAIAFAEQIPRLMSGQG